MKKNFLSLLLILITSLLTGQATTDYTVQIWAETESDPPAININWNPVNGAESYMLYRKTKNGVSWGAPLMAMDATVYSYRDSEVEAGVSYEYQIHKTGNVDAFGYINAGIGIDAVHTRGRMLLLIDDIFSSSLAEEINTLQEDLIGDGWLVQTYHVSRDTSVEYIKDLVLNEFFNHSDRLDAVYCLGHVPVPYSGAFAPDGHTNNHNGAWPTDAYYGDVNGNWTDQFANDVSAAQTRNHNVPGDGKFDQVYFASDIELQVGRVDFANMPAFAESEEELMRRYLNKSHDFKHGSIKARRRAVIDDNFGGFGGEAFAGSAWKSYSAILHPDSVQAGDYRMSMDTSSYLWSYGCGAGSYTSCNGVARTSDLAGDSLQGIFTCLFGSYFGDWDSNNNLLRAALAQGTVLTNCWSGRPHWYFHHMGLGENIGYSTRLSMNNNGILYNTPLGFMANIVSMGLMGDPSLRMHIIEPPSNLVASFNGNHTELNWDNSLDSDRTYVYRSRDMQGGFELLTDEALTDNYYVDECVPDSGSWYYMVRATKMEEVPSGSYQNLSQGIFIEIDVELELPMSAFASALSMDSLIVVNNSVNATSWYWDFGDGTTSTEFQPGGHLYEMSGEYLISLIVSNGCFQDTSFQNFSVILSDVSELMDQGRINIFPNPSNGQFNLETDIALKGASIRIYDLAGRKLKELKARSTIGTQALDLEELYPGMYMMQIVHERGHFNFTLYIQ